MVKIVIKPSNIKYGIRHSEIRGRHNINEDTPKVEIKTKKDMAKPSLCPARNNR